MRRYLPLFSLVFLLSSPALAQKKGAGLQPFAAQPKQDQTEEEIRAARRKAAGIQDLQAFGATREVPAKPFPWMGVGLAVLVMLACAPLGWKLYKSTRRDLEDSATFGTGKARKEVGGSAEGEAPRLSKRPPSRALKAAESEREPEPEAEGEGEATARDAVWDAVSSSGDNWVTADWVATKAGLSAKEAAEEIGALVDEGYLQEARDNKGKPVFKAS